MVIDYNVTFFLVLNQKSDETRLIFQGKIYATQEVCRLKRSTIK
jgi:hypothetical protein